MALLVKMLTACAPVAGFVFVSVAIEFAAPRERYPLRSRFPTAIWSIIQPALVALAVYPIMALWRHLGIPPLIDLSGWHFGFEALVTLLLFDGLRYCSHRLQHRMWWPFHAVHHSIRELHAANSYAHPLEGPVEAIIVLIPLSLIQTSPEALLLAGGVSGFQNVIIHSPIRLHAGPLRAIFVDAPFHRIHHSLEPQHHDKNFGFVFSFWDRLFGTAFQPAPGEWPATGLHDLAPPQSFAGYLLHPLQHFPKTRLFTRPSG